MQGQFLHALGNIGSGTLSDIDLALSQFGYPMHELMEILDEEAR